MADTAYWRGDREDHRGTHGQFPVVWDKLVQLITDPKLSKRIFDILKLVSY